MYIKKTAILSIEHNPHTHINTHADHPKSVITRIFFFFFLGAIQKRKKEKKKNQRTFFDGQLIKLQSANVPSCALISKIKLPVDLQLQSTLCSTGPGGWTRKESLPEPLCEKVRTTDCALWALRLDEEDRQKKWKKEKTQNIDSSVTAGLEQAPLQVAPFLWLQLRAHFWHQKKVRRYERKISKTEQNKKYV